MHSSKCVIVAHWRVERSFHWWEWEPQVACFSVCSFKVGGGGFTDDDSCCSFVGCSSVVSFTAAGVSAGLKRILGGKWKWEWEWER